MADRSDKTSVELVLDPTVVVDDVKMNFLVQEDSSGRKRALRKSVNRRSGGRIVVPALKGVSFIAQHGESIGIIGRNGSGKSTLSNLISGSLTPTSGGVYASSVPTKLGVSSALVPQLSGHQNIILGCLAMGLTPDEIDAKYEDILEVSGLEDAVRYPMATYSSGMSSRLRFAIATSVDPEILIIDEALNTGDAQFRNRSTQKMNELREKAGTVFLVSHSLSTIKAVCTRVLWLDYGRLIMDDSPARVIEKYSRFTKFLAGNMVDKAENFVNVILKYQHEVEITGLESGRRRSE